jgi:DNA-directed RNA polymerase subunit RPC12/RpoP
MPEGRNDEACSRCGREFSLDDPRRGEWEEFQRTDGPLEWVCPHCQTDVDIRAAVDDLAVDSDGDDDA